MNAIENSSSFSSDQLSRMVSEIQKKNATMGPFEVLKEAIRQLLDQSNKPEAQAQHDAKKLEAEQYTTKIRKGERRRRHQEQAKIRQEAKTEPAMDNPKDVAKAVQEVLRERGGNPPDWLRIDAILESPEVAEFAVRVSMLPTSLQNNPDVIYHELSRLYYRTQWNSDELSQAARQETLEMVSRAYAEVLTSKGFQEDAFIDEIDNRPNLYRTNKLKVIEDPGEEPKKSDKDYDKWLKDKQLYDQRNQLHQSLTAIQRQLDDLPDPELAGSITDQYQTYREIQSALRQHQNVLNRIQGELVPGKTYSKGGDAADAYAKTIREWLRQADARTTEIGQQLRAEENRGHITASFDETDVQKILTREQYEAWKKRAETGAGFRKDLRSLKHNDVKMMKTGIDGFNRFVNEKLFGIYGPGREHEKPTLLDQYQYEEFQEVFIWLFGDEQGRAALTHFDFEWSDFGKQDFYIKTLLYKPGDPKDKFGAIRQFLGADIDSSAEVEYANITSAAYLQVLDIHQADGTGRWQESVDFLRSKVTAEDDPELAGKMTYNKYYKLLSTQQKLNTLPDEKYQRFLEIEEHVQRCAKGTGLTDEDFLVYNEAHNQLSRLRLAYDSLVARKERNEPLTEKENGSIQTLEREIQKKMKQEEYLSVVQMSNDLEYLRARQKSGQPFSPQEEAEMVRLDGLIKEKSVQVGYMTSQGKGERAEQSLSLEDLYLRRGYSPIEWEVHTIIKPLVIKELEAKGKLFDPVQDEWRLRAAIHAARRMTIFSGHVMSKTAFNVIKPMALASELDSTVAFAGKSVMWAPIMEDVIRAINVDYFEERFNMGDPWGAYNRANRFVGALQSKGYDAKRIESSAEYKALESQKLTQEERLSRAFTDIVRRETGIESEYMLTGGWNSRGLAVDGSYWRPEGGWLDELKLYCEKHGKPHAWKNMAIWLRFAMLDPKKEEDIAARETLLHIALDRQPSKFFQLFAGRVVNDIKSKYNIGEKEWRGFMRALTTTEIQLWQSLDLASRNVVLRDDADFRALLLPNLTKSLAELGVSSEARAGVFQSVLKDLYMAATATTGRENLQYASRLQATARHTFPVALSYADLDVGVANFFKLGTAELDRRGRDLMNQQQADGIIMELDTKPEFVRPHGEKLWEEWIKKIYELRSTEVSQTDPNKAESSALEMVRQNFKFNRSRVKDIRNILGWIPGSGTIMRKIATTEPEHLPILSRFPQWHKFLKENNLVGKKIAQWPRSVGFAVSGQVGFFGPEGEDLDIHKIDHLIDMLEFQGVFAKNHQFYGMLRREFGTTAWSRLLDIPRKYWWVVIFATVGVAALEATQEEKKH